MKYLSRRSDRGTISNTELLIDHTIEDATSLCGRRDELCQFARAQQTAITAISVFATILSLFLSFSVMARRTGFPPVDSQ